MIQLYNKVSHVKKLLRKSENILTTHNLRRKIAQHIENPESEVSPYIPYDMIEDEDDEDTRMIVIIATDKYYLILKLEDKSMWMPHTGLHGRAILSSSVASQVKLESSMAACHYSPHMKIKELGIKSLLSSMIWIIISNFGWGMVLQR